MLAISDVTPVKAVKTIYCRTCHKHLETSKDKYKLYGAQQLVKILEDVLGVPVESNDDNLDYVCSSCRSKLTRFVKVDKECAQIKPFFRESNHSEFIPALVRLKRGRKTPPNASQFNKQVRESTIAPKAARSINFANQSNQSEALTFSSHKVLTTSTTEGPSSYLFSESRASVELNGDLIIPSINKNRNKSTQTLACKSAKEENIEEKLVVSCII